MAEFDIVVRGGLIVDGSGHEPFVGDVGILGDRVCKVGQISDHGRHTIDAAGRIVTPGFVDIHTHYDGQVTWENSLEPSSCHGVTTVVMGNCGVGFAPCKAADRQKLVRVMEGVEDIPELVMAEGLPWHWETYPEYLDYVARRSFDIDCASYLPHAAVRVFVMGDRAVTGQDATHADLARMTQIVVEALQAGAIGVSSSRTMFHRDSAGAPAPHVRSGRDELIALARGLRQAGRGVFQLVPRIADRQLPTDGEPPDPEQVIESEVGLLRELAEVSGRPLSFALLDSKDSPDEHLAVLRMVERVNAEGTTLRAQVLPRPIGLLLGLELSLHPFRYHPSYQPLAGLPLSERVSALHAPALRRQLLAETPDARFGNPVQLLMASRALNAYKLGDPPRYDLDDSMSVIHEATRRNVSTWEQALDWLLENDGTQVLLAPLGNNSKPNLGAVSEMLAHPHTLIGLGDGGAHYGLLCDSSFPTTTLAYWTRDRQATDRLCLQDAVHFLSQRNARAVGLEDRGLLAAGKKADLNVINYQQLQLATPTVRFDLPAGGRRVVQHATGFDATVVSGTLTRRNDQPTGALPGKLVRG